MEALKFTLSGKTAFFKKPEVNTYYYFTYGHVHKIALMGIFGAIMGYGGYNQMEEGKDLIYPEFYEKCKNLKISIVPNNKKGLISKKMQAFNNSVGYASKEQGGNLIVKEQWLENPSWDIYLLLDSELSNEISTRIQQHKAMYAPYLGKNDHLASIEDIEVVPISQVNLGRICLNSLYVENMAEYVILSEDEEEEMDHYVEYMYREKLPLKLDEATNYYIMASFVYTDALLEIKENQDIYSTDKLKLAFY